jgi:hypothetical protein
LIWIFSPGIEGLPWSKGRGRRGARAWQVGRRVPDIFDWPACSICTSVKHSICIEKTVKLKTIGNILAAIYENGADLRTVQMKGRENPISKSGFYLCIPRNETVISKTEL